MTSKVWSIGIQKHTKMIQHHVHIRSTDQPNAMAPTAIDIIYRAPLPVLIDLLI